ncbi:glutamine synthetase family protein [Burkholderia cenocepacia]|uniref:glutamine synthetase family protein n=1 Tax=Burkholderia cenocepacia TaxID=95486 RepID=UPI002653B11F|nr:glutamine synthetase [Burkholderia cenocepacia]MDN7631584.1 glutamine synthetase [Burkholderia cenocepacia]
MMQAREVRTAADARKIVEERGLTHVEVAVTDIDGLLRGKYLSREKFLSSLENGCGFCNVLFGCDCNDKLYDAKAGIKYSGWHNGYRDDEIRIIPESCRELPHKNSLLFLAEVASDDGSQVCPRNLLSRVLARAEGLGFGVASGFEFEFYGFNETPQSAAEKGYRNLNLLTPSSCQYSVLRASVQSELFQDLLNLGQLMDFPIEALHTEAGEGAMEAALALGTGIKSADRAVLFKTFSKVIAQRRDITLSFMAKYSMEMPGCGGHLHLSLKDRDGKPVFFDPEASQQMSTTMRHFIAGQQLLMPEFLSLVAPTVNSYSRLVPGYWAPTSATWGIDNRTCALRVVGGSANSKRIEYRVTSADSNPYLVQAAVLASGLWGIEHELEPTPPSMGNAYAQTVSQELELPRTLSEAAQRLRGSKAARTCFGDGFVEHFAATRELEDLEYRRHVSDWELKRYFELI